MLAYLTSIPTVAGAMAAAPLLLAAGKGVMTLRRLQRIQRIQRVDRHWRLVRITAHVFAMGWIGGAVGLLAVVVGWSAG